MCAFLVTVLFCRDFCCEPEGGSPKKTKDKSVGHEVYKGAVDTQSNLIELELWSLSTMCLPTGSMDSKWFHGSYYCRRTPQFAKELQVDIPTHSCPCERLYKALGSSTNAK